MKNYPSLYSKKNLLLAWNRICTGANHQHKRYFRHLYAAYAIALKENIQALSTRLSHGSYQPQKPIRIYIPKPSGLQRPLTLLSIEDQIVLQAMANVFATKLRARRQRVEQKCVFSNVLSNDKDNIFFLKDWHNTYQSFVTKIDTLIKNGICWVGEFDLAAYYDTIAHDLLLKTAFPRNGLGDLYPRLIEWFNIWSAEKRTYGHGHGIPQGPIASDLLAECFLLPIDEKIGTKHLYLRYVDDIRLFGKSRIEVQKAVIELEILCRNRGLIPQAKKCGIRKVTSTEAVLQFIPSLAFLDEYPEAQPRQLSEKGTLIELRKSLGGRPLRIQDKTRARFALYRGRPSVKLRRYLLALLPHHPEHIDAFLYSLSQCPANQKTKEVIERLIKDSPYQYVRGESWLLLASILNPEEMRRNLEQAVATARDSHSGFSETWGACTFLCKAERLGLGNYSKWALYKPSLLQALLVPYIPRARFAQGDMISQIIKRKGLEPGLAIASRLVQERISLKALGVKPNSLTNVVRQVYKKLGLVQGPVPKIEPIAELLTKTINVTPWSGWQKLLGKDYRYACQFLAQAAPVVFSNRSLWLIYQNSFDQTIFMAIQRWLAKEKKPGVIRLKNDKGELENFGTMLDANNAFSRSYASIAKAFRSVNARRNTVPEAHPYIKKSGDKTKPLRVSEQKENLAALKSAFQEIAGIVDML